MAKKEVGKQSVEFECPPLIVGAASVVGQKEGQGPYGKYFDRVETDPKAGQETWEEAEERLQQLAAEAAIEKSGLEKKDIRYIVAGDLLGQLIASSFGLMSFDIPIFGVYGACSTMGESLAIGSMLVDGGYADRVVALTSSHFASAEKQFRFPLGYGNQRPQAATWTVTGSGAVVLSSQRDTQKKLSGKTNTQNIVQVRGITTGKIVDYGIKDSMNMGACMAPAAADVIAQNMQDFSREPKDYDKIITGDLGLVGRKIVLDILSSKGYDIESIYMDCGIEIYGSNQNVQSGGSGCGCSAVMLTGYILQKLQKGEWNRVLFVPTGALLSPVSFNEGKSVPGIAHGVILESAKEK
jgi:stage V sporulation protein AD